MQIPPNAVSTWITPRVSETDGCGHINNTTLPVWFEAGRREFFRAVSPSLSFDDWNIAVVSMQVQFHKQIYLHDDVCIATWVSKLGNKSMVVNEVALQAGEVCASGECAYVYFNYANQQSERVPDAIRQRLAPMLHEPSPSAAPSSSDVNPGYFFEDLEVGMSDSLTRVVTADDIKTFSAITGDRNPIHLDEEWAAKTRFKGRIAHGILTGGLVSAVMGTRLPGPGNIYIKQTLEFLGPVRPGDTVTAEVRITQLEPAKNRVFLDTVCRCGDAEVLRGEAVLRVQSRAKLL